MFTVRCATRVVSHSQRRIRRGTSVNGYEIVRIQLSRGAVGQAGRVIQQGDVWHGGVTYAIADNPTDLGLYAGVVVL